MSHPFDEIVYGCDRLADSDDVNARRVARVLRRLMMGYVGRAGFRLVQNAVGDYTPEQHRAVSAVMRLAGRDAVDEWNADGEISVPGLPTWDTRLTSTAVSPGEGVEQVHNADCTEDDR